MLLGSLKNKEDWISIKNLKGADWFHQFFGELAPAKHNLENKILVSMTWLAPVQYDPNKYPSKHYIFINPPFSTSPCLLITTQKIFIKNAI